MIPTPREVVARRRAERQAAIQRARSFAEDLDPSLSLQAVVVVGSVARGDFNAWSDIDVLVVAERLPDHPVERLRAVGSPAAGGIEAVVWTPHEWTVQRRRGNPLAAEAATHGVWVVGDLEALEDATPKAADHEPGP